MRTWIKFHFLGYTQTCNCFPRRLSAYTSASPVMVKLSFDCPFQPEMELILVCAHLLLEFKWNLGDWCELIFYAMDAVGLLVLVK